MKNTLWAFALLTCSLAVAEEPAAPTAKLRVAGVFVRKFTVWRTSNPNCGTPATAPWLKLYCGIRKCPKPASLGIPLDLNYKTWRANPNQTEVRIEAGRPFVMHLGGIHMKGSLGEGFSAEAGLPYTVSPTSCVFHASFTPRAGAMYEATVDPFHESCVLVLTEIRHTPAGGYERFAVEGAEVKACPN
jgi:hypothetical protein